MEDFVFGKSAAIRKVRAAAEAAAACDLPVLLLGETGTGKGLLARWIHHHSQRSEGAFVEVDVPSFAPELMGSELFGHERGAFTGAVKCHRGWFERTDGGTIFLDEIGELAPELQAKLLRVVEGQAFCRVGGERAIRVDVRVLAATNRDLVAEVAEGRFRADLYYRLTGIEIQLPALRERREDIGPLLDHYVGKFSKAYGKSVRLSQPAKEVLLKSPWPGNIRELRHLVETLVVMSRGEVVGSEQLPLEVHRAALMAVRADEELLTLRRLEAEYIARVLQWVGYRKKRAAKILGISLNTLKRKIEEYGLWAEENG